MFIRWTKDQTGRYHIRARIWEVSGGRFRKNIKKRPSVYYVGDLSIGGYMITPVEVLGKELKRGFGYKAVEVDEFLEELAKDYEKVYKENNDRRILKESIGSCGRDIQRDN